MHTHTPTHAITAYVPIHPRLRRCSRCLDVSDSDLKHSPKPFVNGSTWWWSQHGPKNLTSVTPLYDKIDKLCVWLALCVYIYVHQNIAVCLFLIWYVNSWIVGMWLFLLGCYVLDTAMCSYILLINPPRLVLRTKICCIDSVFTLKLVCLSNFFFYLKGIQPLLLTFLWNRQVFAVCRYVSGRLFHFIWKYSGVSLCGPWTYCNCYFHTSQDGCTSLLLVGSAMNPLVSLLFTKPKLSHNDHKSDYLNFQRPPRVVTVAGSKTPDCYFVIQRSQWHNLQYITACQLALTLTHNVWWFLP